MYFESLVVPCQEGSLENDLNMKRWQPFVALSMHIADKEGKNNT